MTPIYIFTYTHSNSDETINYRQTSYDLEHLLEEAAAFTKSHPISHGEITDGTTGEIICTAQNGQIIGLT